MIYEYEDPADERLVLWKGILAGELDYRKSSKLDNTHNSNTTSPPLPPHPYNTINEQTRSNIPCPGRILSGGTATLTVDNITKPKRTARMVEVIPSFTVPRRRKPGPRTERKSAGAPD